MYLMIGSYPSWHECDPVLVEVIFSSCEKARSSCTQVAGSG